MSTTIEGNETGLAVTEVPAKKKKPTVLQRLSLYEITLEGKLIEDILIEGDGELTPETEKRMDDLLRQGAPRIEGAVLIIKELEASAEAARAEAQRLTKRAQSFERNAEGLKNRVVVAVDAAFSGKVKTDRVTVWTQAAKDSITFEFLASDQTLENLYNAHPEVVKQETVYSLDKDALMRKWEEEAPLREANAQAEYEYHQAMLQAQEERTDKPVEPEIEQSAIPAVIEVKFTPGRRFLQTR